MSFKRVLALVLALTMIFSLAMPGSWAFAEEDDGIVAVEDEYNEEGIVEDPVEEVPTVIEETPAEEPAAEVIVPNDEPAEEPEETEEEEEELEELLLEDLDTFEAIGADDVAKVGKNGYASVQDAVTFLQDNGIEQPIYLLANSDDPITISGGVDITIRPNATDGETSGNTIGVVTVSAGAEDTVKLVGLTVEKLTLGTADAANNAAVELSNVTVNSNVEINGGKLTYNTGEVKGTVNVNGGSFIVNKTETGATAPTFNKVEASAAAAKRTVKGGNFGTIPSSLIAFKFKNDGGTIVPDTDNRDKLLATEAANGTLKYYGGFNEIPDNEKSLPIYLFQSASYQLPDRQSITVIEVGVGTVFTCNNAENPWYYIATDSELHRYTSTPFFGGIVNLSSPGTPTTDPYVVSFGQGAARVATGTNLGLLVNPDFSADYFPAQEIYSLPDGKNIVVGVVAEDASKAEALFNSKVKTLVSAADSSTHFIESAKYSPESFYFYGSNAYAYTITSTPIVAKIGNTPYESLSAAVAAVATPTDVIELYRSDSHTMGEGQSLTIQKMSESVNLTLNVTEGAGWLYVDPEVATNTDAVPYTVKFHHAVVDGTFYPTLSEAAAHAGNKTIKVLSAAAVKLDKTEGSADYIELTETLKKVTIDKNGQATFDDSLVYSNVAGKAIKKTVDGNITTYELVDAVASIGYKTYASLEEAIEDAGLATSTIILHKNVKQGVTIDEGQKITIDLNGNNIAGGTADAILNKGTLTVIGSGIASATDTGKAAIANVPGGVVTLNGGTYRSDNWYAIKNLGTMTIDGVVTVDKTQGNTNTASLIANGWANAKDTVGGTEYTADVYAGKDGIAVLTISNANVNCNGGTNSCSVVKNDDYGTLNITGGNFSSRNNTGTSNAATLLNWGTAEISGGSFEGMYPISVGSAGNEADPGNITISGGTFTSLDTQNKILIGQGGGHVSGEGSLEITGGVFDGKLAKRDYPVAVSGGTFTSAVPADCCADGYEPSFIGNGKYGVNAEDDVVYEIYKYENNASTLYLSYVASQSDLAINEATNADGNQYLKTEAEIKLATGTTIYLATDTKINTAATNEVVKTYMPSGSTEATAQYIKYWMRPYAAELLNADGGHVDYYSDSMYWKDILADANSKSGTLKFLLQPTAVINYELATDTDAYGNYKSLTFASGTDLTKLNITEPVGYEMTITGNTYAITGEAVARYDGKNYKLFKEAVAAIATGTDADKVVYLYKVPTEANDYVMLDKDDTLQLKKLDGFNSTETLNNLNETLQFMRVPADTLTPVANDSIHEYTLGNRSLGDKVREFYVTHAVAALTNGLPETTYYTSFEDALKEYQNPESAGYYNYIEILDTCEYVMPATATDFIVKDPGTVDGEETVPMLTVSSENENEYKVDSKDGETKGTTVYFVTNKVVSLALTKWVKVNTAQQGVTTFVEAGEKEQPQTMYLTSVEDAVKALAGYEQDATADPHFTYEMKIIANTSYALPTATELIATVADGVTFTPSSADPEHYRLYVIPGGWGTYEIHSITYNFNGGTPATGSIYHESYTEKDKDFAIGDPTQVGFTFKGWSGTGLTGDTNKNITVSLASGTDIELTANWTPIDYTVTLIGNGALTSTGEASFATHTSLGAKINLDEYADAFSWTGRKFYGWTDSNNKYLGTFDAAANKYTGAEYTVTAAATNTDITAQWVYEQYQVSFDLGKGNKLTVGTATYTDTYTVTLNYGSAIANPGTPVNKDSALSFTHWYLATDTSAKPVSFKDITVDSNVAFVAAYSGTVRSIIVKGVNVGGSTADVTVMTVNTGAPITDEIKNRALATATNLAVTGYSFEEFTESWPEVMPNNNIVLTPEYVQNLYTLTYVDVDNEGVVHELNKVSYHYGDKVAEYAATKQGYSMDKTAPWTYSVALGDNNTMPDSDVIAVAKWVGDKVTILFIDRNDIVITTMIATNGDLFKLPDDAKYDAVKGRTAPDGMGLDPDDLWDPEVEPVVNGNKIYKLNWKEKYTVNFVVEGETVSSVEGVVSGTKLSENNIPSAPNDEGVEPYWLINGEEGAYFNVGETMIEGNWDLVATWVAPEGNFKVTWKNADGSTLKTEELAAGETPAWNDDDPTMPNDADGTVYTFKGWDKPITNLTGDTTYTAQYVKHNEKFSYTVAADDSISIFFRISQFPDGADKSKYSVEAEFTDAQGELHTVTKTEDLDKLFVVAECAAKEMTDEVTVRVKYDDVLVAKRAYTVRGYAEARYAATSEPTLKNVLVAMLNYGAAAQVRFNHNTDDLANKNGLTGTYEVKNIPTDKVNVKEGAADGITGVTYSLAAETRTEFEVGFKHASGKTVSDYTFRVNGEPVDATDNGSKFTIKLGGIAAKDLGNTYVVTATDKDNGTYTFTTSPVNYMLASSKIAANTASMTALYNYHLTALAYFNR